MAEYFLDLNRERTMEGLKAALARGRKGGRPKKLSEADLAVARALLAAGTISVADIAKRLGVNRTPSTAISRGSSSSGGGRLMPIRPAYKTAIPGRSHHGVTPLQGHVTHQRC